MDVQIKPPALKDVHLNSSKTPTAIHPMHWLLCPKDVKGKTTAPYWPPTVSSRIHVSAHSSIFTSHTSAC
ncbi:hypothetical protein cypCar_00033647 [Cyprinus carpio]|nr:hypothetical protein cypCar_00033647 [Cyprinus carpio]